MEKKKKLIELISPYFGRKELEKHLLLPNPQNSSISLEHIVLGDLLKYNMVM